MKERSPTQTEHPNRLTNGVDAAGTTGYVYDEAGQLLSEDGPWGNDTVSYSYQNRLRTQLSLLRPNAPAWEQTYAYDGAKRLTNVTSPAGVFSYEYSTGVGGGTATASRLIQRLRLANSAVITNAFDSVARLGGTYLRHSQGGLLNQFVYDNNLAGQRNWVLRGDSSYVDYAYDSRGQLLSAKARESGGGGNRLQEQLGYGYDAAGNLNQRTNNALVQTFNVNNLNELSTASRSGTVTVAGTTSSGASSVTVNGSGAGLYGDHSFAKDGLSLADGTNTFTAIAQDSYGRNDTNTVSLYLPATVTFQYDGNGNLTNDGVRGFEYDDENQLTRVMVTNAWRSDYQYDVRMRLRVRKEYTWKGSAWSLTNEVRYVYDGMLVIQERNASNLPVAAYTRGLDMSASLQGAGGIGGLLAFSTLTTVSPQHYYYYADGNGNVAELLDAQQLVAAQYLYDSFGNLIYGIGPLAEANRYRFSSKEFQSNAGLYYYGYRFYDPGLQRWLNRDPLGDTGSLPVILLIRQESADLNLYRFSSNNSLNNFDPDGLTDRWYAPGSVMNKCDKPVPAVDLDNSKCTIVPPGGKSPGYFTDWDFARLPDGKWYKIGVGRLTVPKDGKYKGTVADKDTSDACEKVYQDYLKDQKKGTK